MRETYLREKARREMQIAKKEDQELRQREEELRKRKERELQTRPKTNEEKEQELEDSRWERVMEMVTKGKLTALQEFVKKHEGTSGGWFGRMPGRLVEGRPELTSGCVSLLQLGALADQTAVVEWMLAETESDPTMVDVKRGASTKGHLTPYELAPSRPTRNVFRRAMARQPGRCDWITKAKVPSALTEEIESNQSLKNKEWNKKIKEKLKERERARALNEKSLLATAHEKDTEPADGPSGRQQQQQQQRKPEASANRLGGGPVSRKPAVLSSTSSLLGLSDDQRLRLERERRARAAEARLK